MIAFNAALAGFVSFVQAQFAAHYAAVSPTMTVPVVSVQMGRRYARVYRTCGAANYVHCFVDMSTGVVHRADSWKAAGRPTALTVYSPRPAIEPRVIPCF